MKKLLLILAAIFVPFMAIGQSLTTTYEYDELNRLVQVNYPNGQRVAYEYDALGNRLSRTVTQENYLITATVTPENAGSVEGAGNYAPGSSATLVATANTGYSFTNWTENGEAVSTTATYTFTVNGARNLVANFTLSSFEITATTSPENAGTISGAGTYYYGDTATIAVTPNAGYTFVNWTENGTEISNELTYSFVVTNAHSLVANFNMISYAIAVSASPEEGGTVTGAGIYNYGQTVTLTATANTGYTFFNWTRNGQQVSNNATYSFPASEAGSYVAHFTLNSYQITAIATPTSGGTVSGGGNYAYGTSVTLNAAPALGYAFVNWTKNGQQVSTNPVFTFTVTGTETYIAHFEWRTYDITVAASPEVGGEVSGAGTYDHGQTCTLTATAMEGYTFINWTKDGEQVSTNATYTFAVTEAGDYVANFELNSYAITVTANLEEGGEVSGGGTYDHGATATLTATAAEGYTFLNWTLGGEVVSTETIYVFAVTEAGDYVANFELNSYEITVAANPEAGGEVTGGGTYDHGATVTLTATVNEGYNFINWMKDGVEVSNELTYTFIVTEAGDYVANFSVNSYEIIVTANPEDGGTVTGAGTYEYGTTVTLTATPNAGYTFVNWLKDGVQVSISAIYTFTMTEAAEGTYVAQFSQNDYVVTAVANPEAGGVVTGSGPYNYGDVCTLTIIPNLGYTFINWTKDSEVVSTELSVTFTVTDNADYVANLSLNSYEITVASNPIEGGEVSGAGTYDYGMTVTLSATVNEGYTFLNWTLGGEVVSNLPTYSFTVIEDGDYVANFELNSYEIIVAADPSEGGTVTGAGTYNHGETATLVATVNEGYTFVSWTRDGTEVSTDASYSFIVEAAGDFVANFSLNSYTITATVNPEAGGEVTGAGIYDHGSIVILTATVNEGYAFASWTKDGEEVSTELSFSFIATEDAAYVANFSLNSYAITAMANPTAGGTITGVGTYNHFETCTLTATAATGHTFVSWTDAAGEVVSTTATYSFEVIEAASFTANFELNSYEVAAVANPEEGGVVTGSGTYDFGATVTLTATAAEGYTFVNWIKEGVQVSINAIYAFTMGEDTEGTYEAQFTQNDYVVTAVANPEAGGVVTGSGPYNYGDVCTLTINPNPGYNFINWTKDGEMVSTEHSVTFTVTGNASYVANLSLNGYEITVAANPTEGGTVTGSGTYDHGATATLTATANEGYTFLNWTKGGEVVSTSATYSFTVTEAASYVANFELNTHEITATANPETGGTVTGAGTYDHGTTVTLIATANEGYTFLNWTKGGEVVATTATYTFTVTEATDYVANFELNTYVITATANPTNGGTVTGAGTYDHGATATLTATANEGYIFLNWTKGGEVVSTNATYSFTVTEAASYVANFELNSYAITVAANPEAGGEVTGAGTYDHGVTATLTATANEGYTFLNWTKGGEVVSTSATYSFTVIEEAVFIANFEATITDITQTSDFVVGWTWWSSSIETEEADVLDQLKTGLGASGQVIKSQTQSTMHMGNNWFGALTMNNENGYMVKSNGVVTVDITGPAATPENHPITLTPGWTWIGYPCSEPMTVAEALANHTPQPNDVIKGQNASAMFMMGQWRGALTLTPGIGLMYKSNSTGNKTLTYATPTRMMEADALATEIHWNANYNAYSTNMTILAVVELNGEEINSEHYELAAFAGNECRGSVRLMDVEPLNRHFALLTVSGEEAAELRFALYDTDAGEEYHNSDETLAYETDAVVGSPDEPFVIRFRSNTGVDEWANSLQVFPNPVERGQSVSLSLSAEEMGEIQVEIINALGMVETRRTTSLQTITAPNVAGVYTLRITVEGKGTCYRKLVVR